MNLHNSRETVLEAAKEKKLDQIKYKNIPWFPFFHNICNKNAEKQNHLLYAAKTVPHDSSIKRTMTTLLKP